MCTQHTHDMCTVVGVGAVDRGAAVMGVAVGERQPTSRGARRVKSSPGVAGLA